MPVATPASSRLVVRMYCIKGKTFMITGAASGIGYEYARIMLSNGAKRVAIVDLATSDGQNSAATLEKEFGKRSTVFLGCDVTRADELERTFKKVVALFQRLDVLINNAGIMDDTRVQQSVDLNVSALMRGSLLAIDHMGKHKGGKGGVIVNVASVFGLSTVNCFVPAYAGTKHAVVGFSRNLADFHKAHGVRVLTMCPGATMTALTTNLEKKIPDYVSPDDIAECVKNLPFQQPGSVARGMLELVQKGENGAVFVAEGGETAYAVDFDPSRYHYKKRVVSAK